MKPGFLDLIRGILPASFGRANPAAPAPERKEPDPYFTTRIGIPFTQLAYTIEPVVNDVPAMIPRANANAVALGWHVLAAVVGRNAENVAGKTIQERDVQELALRRLQRAIESIGDAIAGTPIHEQQDVYVPTQAIQDIAADYQQLPLLANRIAAGPAGQVSSGNLSISTRMHLHPDTRELNEKVLRSGFAGITKHLHEYICPAERARLNAEF